MDQLGVLSRNDFWQRYVSGLGGKKVIVRRTRVVMHEYKQHCDSTIVALATWPCDKWGDDGVDPGALREVALLRGVQHPNLMKLLDVCCNRDQVEIAFACVGCVLKDYVKQNYERIDEQFSRSMCLQVLLGVEFCHSRAVNLRNLKPQKHFCRRKAGQGSSRKTANRSPVDCRKVYNTN